MENQKSNSSLKAIVVVLALFLIGSLVYIFKMTTDAKTLHTELTSVKSEKDNLLDSLAIQKTIYDKAIEDKTALSDDLIAEREKVMNLIADLKKSKGDVASMSKYRDQFKKLQVNMKSLMAENDALKKANETLTVQRDSTVVVLGQQKKFNDTLVVQNENLAKTVEKGSKLVVMNLRTQAIKQRSSGKQIDTDKASRADKLKVCFSIAANSIAKSGDKIYNIQIIDSKNNVLGDKKTETFGELALTYSFSTKVAYNNQSVDICEFLEGNGKDFEKGTYFVNIFDKSELVSKTSFTLR
jgi:Holliday junction resolvase